MSSATTAAPDDGTEVVTGQEVNYKIFIPSRFNAATTIEELDANSTVKVTLSFVKDLDSLHLSGLEL